MDFQLILICVSIFTLTVFIRSAIGFGDAVVAMPLLSLTVGLKLAVPLVALIATTSSLVILSGSLKQTNYRSALKLVFASFMGLPFGVYFLKYAPESIMKIALGILLILFAAYNLFKPNLFVIQDRFSNSFIFGFISGMLGGAYNTTGPPIVIYGQMCKWHPQSFRATLQGFFLPSGIAILISHALGGFWNSTVFKLYGILLPFMFLSIYIGGKVNQKIKPEAFTKWLNIAIMIMGIMLVI